MIPNQWYAVLQSGEVKPGRPVGVVRLGERLVFWRDKTGVVACASDICAHRGAALSCGKVRSDRVECPFHGLQYDRNGCCQLIPANGRTSPVPGNIRVKAYPAREEHGFIWIWWGAWRDDLPPVGFPDDLAGFSYSTFRDHWPVHYSRAIENQLDVVHLPFVHYNTIGRGNRTLVDGPIARLGKNDLLAWVYNRVDDGMVAMRAEELTEPSVPPNLRLIFPNVWRLHIAPAFRILVAFAPVDEDNTVLYVRFYQGLLRLPVLNKLFAALGYFGARTIVRQDKRVVVTQLPRKSGLKMGENLILGDRPIVLYRQRRQELIDSARAEN